MGASSSTVLRALGVVLAIALVAPACATDGGSSGGTPAAEDGLATPLHGPSPLEPRGQRAPNYNAGPADTTHSVVRRGPDVVQLSRAESSRALRDLPAVAEDAEEDDENHEVHRIPRHAPRAPVADDPVRQPHGPISTMPAAILNFKGQGASTTKKTVTGTPPDTNGAVGPKNFVQTVNGGIQVWDKSGNIVKASVPLNFTWVNYVGTNTGNSCASNNNGDPVVVYDGLADRWFLSQFSLPNTTVETGPAFQCVAVSKTGDPTGEYWLYDFSYPAAINDYGKFSIWPDGYYATFNLFGAQDYIGGDLCAFDRVSMLQGLPATQQCFTNPNAYGVQPGNLDGKIAPPIGEPGYFAMLDSDASGNFTNNLDLWTLHLDWTTPASSKLTGPTLLPVAAFAPTCGTTTTTCIPQAGLTNTLDSLDDRLMFRLSYRNFGTHEALLVNHSVLAGAVGGVRWYEIRSPAGTPVVYQQGTYAPADGSWRWMGSLAQDQAEDVVLGYSISSSTKDPSIGWTGRLPSDALGTMGQGESTLDNGSSFETSQASRWGDYSNMTVDPADDCTFWYTQELYNTSGTTTWDTFVAAVKMPRCAANDFSIALSPTSAHLPLGGNAAFTVSTASTAGTAETIVLNIQDLPPGVTAAFSPTTVTAGSSSTLTLTASATAPSTGVPPTFTVIGTAPSAVHPAMAQVSVGTCTPHACPPAANCGTVSDGCGGTVTCAPGCTAPQSCAGGGTPNVCGCTPTTTTCPASQVCGTVPDGCGGTVICGTCTAPQTCGGGGTPGACGCTPSVAACPAGATCGTADDGCGGTAVCANGNTCAAGQTCQANVCVSPAADDAGVGPVVGVDAGGGVGPVGGGEDGGTGDNGGAGAKSGCACRAAGGENAPSPGLFALAGIGVVAMRRRRRRH